MSCPDCNSEYVFPVGPDREICADCKTVYDIVEKEKPKGIWRTIKGAKVFIREGQSLDEVLSEMRLGRYRVMYSTSDPKIHGEIPIPFFKMGARVTQEGAAWGEVKKTMAKYLKENPGKALGATISELNALTGKWLIRKKYPLTTISPEVKAEKIMKEYHKWKTWTRSRAWHMGREKGLMTKLYSKFKAGNISAPEMDILNKYAKKYHLDIKKKGIAIKKHQKTPLYIGAPKTTKDKEWLRTEIRPNKKGGYTAIFYNNEGAQGSQQISERDLEYFLWSEKKEIAEAYEETYGRKRSPIARARARYRITSRSKSTAQNLQIGGRLTGIGLDFETDDSFMDLVTWVMANMSITDEKEAKEIAWKIINSKKGTGGSSKGKGKKPKPEPKPPEVDPLIKKAWEIINQAKEYFEEYKTEFINATDYDSRRQALAKMIQLANEFRTQISQNVPSTLEDVYKPLQDKIDNEIKKGKAEIKREYQLEVSDKADRLAIEQRENEDKHYWESLKVSINKKESWELADARRDKNDLLAREKRAKADPYETWHYSDKKELKIAKDYYNSVSRELALQKFLLEIKAPANFHFDKKALMFTKSSKNLKANKAYLKDIIKDYKIIPARFRGRNPRYTDNGDIGINFVWKVPAGWKKHSQRTGGDHNPRTGRIRIASERKLRERFRDSIIAHEVGHAVHAGLDRYKHHKWADFTDIYNDSKQKITKYGDGQLYNREEFFAVLFAEYTTGKIHDGWRGSAYKRGAHEKYYLQSYPKAWKWFVDNYSIKGFQGHQIVKDYDKTFTKASTIIKTYKEVAT